MARPVTDGALAKSAALHLKPIAVAVFDDRGCPRFFAALDGTSRCRGSWGFPRHLAESEWQESRSWLKI
jgi:uncharacterized protein GlcG (DUF336 family)